MQKPYRGDYKPDYEKWNKIGLDEERWSLFEWFLLCVFFFSTIFTSGSFLFDFYEPWSDFSFKNDILFSFGFYFKCFLFSIFINFLARFDKILVNKDKYKALAEQEAEQNYQNDMDRYEHYWATKYEEAIRQANIDATVRGISNEELLRTYVRLAEINNQVNERNFALFNQARQALESRNTYSIDDTLNQFRQKFLG